MNSPKEQYIIYKWINIDLSISNVILYFIIAGIKVIIISKGIKTDNKIVTNNWKIISESLYRTIL